jgi:hypothetical protein
MVHLIPKKSKVNLTIWKNFTIADLGLLLIFSTVAVLIMMSNMPGKWFIEFVYTCVVFALFCGNDDIKIYQIVVHIFRYLFGVKKYGTAARKNTRKNSVDLLMPQTALKSDGIIEYDGLYYGGVLNVGSIEYRLLDEYSQDEKVMRFAQIINALTPEQQCQIIKIDRPINFDEIGERLFQKIQTAKESDDIPKQVLLKSRLAQVDMLNNIEKQYRPFYYLVFFDESENSLKNTLNFVKTSLQEMSLQCEQLNQKETAVFLKYCYTRNFDEREIDKIEPKDYLNWVKPKSIELKILNAKVDNIFTATFGISDFPLTVNNAWGSRLFNIDNTKVVLNIKPVDKDRSVKRIDRVITELSSKENVYKASEMLQTDTHIETMGMLLSNLQNENENLFDCTMTITGFNYNNEDTQAFRKRIRSAIMGNGFRSSYLMFRQIDGIISSSVTRRNSLKRYERGINSLSLASVFPFVFTSIIDTEGIALGHNSYPVLLDVWKRSYTYTNSNMFVVGKTGGGKSYFTKTLLSMLYSDNCKICVLDPENEYNTMAKNFGGKMVDVGSATSGRLNPFHIYGMLTDDGTSAASDVIFTNHLRFLESFFKIVVKELRADSVELLNNFILETYKDKGITQDIDCSNFTPDKFPIFDDLVKVIDKHLAEKSNNPIQRNNLELVKTHIEKFAGEGRNAKLWNGPSTLTTAERFEVFNFQSLLEGKNTTISNAQMLLVMRYLEQQIINIREQNRDKPEAEWLHPVIVLDEGYNFIDPNYPIALDFVYMWYKRIRKYGGLICFITQNLGDIFGNQEIISKTTAITNNSQYSFIFPLAPADIATLTELYRNAGEINDAERSEIANGQRGHCFLISAPRERTSFQVVANGTVADLFSNVRTPEEIKDML